MPVVAVLYLAAGVVVFVVQHHICWLTFALPPIWGVQWWISSRAPRTVVQPAGLRVRISWRWRDIDWSNVESVKNLTPWSTATMTIQTATGDEVSLPGLAAARGGELLAYARDHSLVH